MLRRKLAESLTVRIFLLTFLLLLGAGGLTFALIAWATPITYTAVISDRLQAQVADLTQQLAQTNLADAGPILDAFVRESGAEVALTAPGGAEADTGSLLVLPEEDWQVAVTMSGADNSVQTYEADTYQVQIDRADGVVTATQTGILTTQITFADQEGTYQLLVSPQLRLANQAVEALGRVAPWLALALLAFSLLCAFGYSRLCAFFYSQYITRPIVRLNGIAGRMAELDLQWVCGERRRDEIGQLGRSLDKMAGRLCAHLTDLETANQALRGEVARERELDRQRMAFFSAASHELKTPVTILKGQLAGMLEGVGVYQDRDKYLLRSLQTTGRMERLIGEMLSISRMESGSAAVRQEPVDLSALMAQQLALDRELLEQRGQQLVSALTPGITVPADASLLGKAVGNLLSNASRYSPEGAEIRVWCGRLEGRPALSVENTGARISGDALPHLFEAFYREESSRNRSTGGSGLGLYLVKMILDRHGAVCTIENTEEGVKATVRF
ncbi:HAMP domain-containing sensor histidine kinase [Dysosmobacter welbionis]|uniref:HAMP domain-containing sensor histidine kinase n=1 Tax=Dysosmobacter welbionis TaxID=2093857 RepID=UPI00307A36A5